MNQHRASGTANAKLIIVGEHFVVPFTDSAGVSHPGSSALAIPLNDLASQVSLSSAERVACTLTTTAKTDVSMENVGVLMERALRFAAHRFGWDLAREPLSADSTSNFPTSRGLGSSASFSVALTRALASLTGKQPDLRAESQLIENLFHGKSSGLDTATIATEKPILYRNGEVVRTFNPVAVDFVVADSGPRIASSSLVSKTMDLRMKKTDFWKTLSNQLDRLTDECLRGLESPTGAPEVARIIRNAQEILTEVGLMNDQLGSLLSLGEKHGALAGKMSGAGSGGIVFFVTPKGEGKSFSQRMINAGAHVVTVI